MTAEFQSLFQSARGMPLVVAEISANHNGSLQKAMDTITAAKQSGADAVKIQTYTADTMTLNSEHPDFTIRGGPWAGNKLYDLYKQAQTPYEWHEPLFKHAKHEGIPIFSTVFDETAVDLLEKLETPAYKVSSFELIDLPLIRYVAKTRRPLFLSTGMASKEEIAEAVGTAKEAGCSELVLLHCISSYPAPIEQANLTQMTELKTTFKTPVGLSDHTMGMTASIAAVAMGAKIIEKHFTLSRKDKGPDSGFSFEPDELRRLCEELRNTWLSLGQGEFRRAESEQASKALRRSLYFGRDLPAGHAIVAADFRRIRPAGGLPPKFADEIIGKVLRVGVKKADPVNWEVFKRPAEEYPK